MEDEVYAMDLHDLLNEAIQWWQLIRRGVLEGYTQDVIALQAGELDELRGICDAVDSGDIAEHHSAYADARQRLRDYCIKMRRAHGDGGPW